MGTCDVLDSESLGEGRLPSGDSSLNGDTSLDPLADKILVDLRTKGPSEGVPSGDSPSNGDTPSEGVGPSRVEAGRGPRQNTGPVDLCLQVADPGQRGPLTPLLPAAKKTAQ